MTKVITRKGEEGQLVFDDKNQRVLVKVGNVEYLVTYMRDNKVKIKNDVILNDADLQHVRTYMKKFVKVVETGKKQKRKYDISYFRFKNLKIIKESV